MKPITLIMAAALTIFAACGPSYRVTNQSAVNADTTGVPNAVKSSFNAQYPNASNIAFSPYDANNLPIDWDLSGWPDLQQGAYVAMFNMDNNQYYAWYDANGNWIGSTYSVRDYKSLPSAITTTLNDKFPGYSITSVNSEMQKDKMAYEIQLKNGDSKAKVLVDANGNIIKQKTVTK